MKRKRLSTALLLAVALGSVAFTVIRMRSTGADVSTQGSEPAGSEPLGTEPPESVFGPHSYELSDYWEFAFPPEDLPPPAISRDEIITRVQPTGSGSIVSVDLVTVINSPVVDGIPGRQWLVVKRDVVWRALLGGPIPLAGSRCDVPPDERPPSCLQGRHRGMLLSLHDAETAELITLEFYGEERCDIPAEGVEPC